MQPMSLPDAICDAVHARLESLRDCPETNMLIYKPIYRNIALFSLLAFNNCVICKVLVPWQPLSYLGDPLEVLNERIPWETFRPVLEPVHQKPRKSNAGRKPIDVVLMFKVRVLQSLYNLADEPLEYPIRDRLSFRRFLGLSLMDRVPDGTTVGLFRERLKELGLMKPLFDPFGDDLEASGYQARSGPIIDARIVRVPIPRNRRDENAQIKAGEVPEGWSEAKREPNDGDARWTEQHGKPYYGYKNPIDGDAEHQFVRTDEVTPAHVHDSQVFDAGDRSRQRRS